MKIKTSKIFLLASFQICNCKFPQVLAKKILFWSTKIQISPELLGQIWKISRFLNLLIKDFKISYKSNNFNELWINIKHVLILVDFPILDENSDSNGIRTHNQ